MLGFEEGQSVYRSKESQVTPGYMLTWKLSSLDHA